MKILCLETATTNCSVAIGINGELEGIKEENSGGYSHGEQLHVFVNQLLSESGMSLTDLDAVSVSMGPGSYTGLRIGVSAAKGFCFAADLPLVAVPTLQILASQIKIEKHETILALLDARRMEVYANAYNKEFQPLLETKPVIIGQDSFQNLRDLGHLHIIGSGAEKCKQVFGNRGITYHSDRVPSAKEQIHWATEKFIKKEFEDVAYFEPFYLKEFFLQGKTTSR